MAQMSSTLYLIKKLLPQMVSQLPESKMAHHWISVDRVQAQFQLGFQDLENKAKTLSDQLKENDKNLRQYVYSRQKNHILPEISEILSSSAKLSSFLGGFSEEYLKRFNEIVNEIQKLKQNVSAVPLQLPLIQKSMEKFFKNASDRMNEVNQSNKILMQLQKTNSIFLPLTPFKLSDTLFRI